MFSRHLNSVRALPVGVATPHVLVCAGLWVTPARTHLPVFNHCGWAVILVHVWGMGASL